MKYTATKTALNKIHMEVVLLGLEAWSSTLVELGRISNGQKQVHDKFVTEIRKLAENIK